MQVSYSKRNYINSSNLMHVFTESLQNPLGSFPTYVFSFHSLLIPNITASC